MSAELVPATSRGGLLRPVEDPAAIIAYKKELRDMIASSLTEGKDYGRVPGTERPILMKAGAETLCMLFGIEQDFEVVESQCETSRATPYSITKWVTADKPKNRAEEDQLKSQGKGRNKKFGDKWVWQIPITEQGQSEGLYRYLIKCRLVRRETGEIVASGLGSCSSLESKYIRAPHDAENTVLKMACKRAHVAATLSAFGLSDYFTQDLEDITDNAQSRQEAPNSEAKPPPNPGTEFLRSLGLSEPELAEFKGICADLDRKPSEVALESKSEGVDNAETLLVYARGLIANPAETKNPFEFACEVLCP